MIPGQTAEPCPEKPGEVGSTVAYDNLREIANMLSKYKFQVVWTTGEAFWFAIGVTLLSIITLGIGSFFVPFMAARRLVDGTIVLDPEGKILGVLHVDATAYRVSFAVKWIAFSLITAGIMAIVYPYAVMRQIANYCHIVDADERVKRVEYQTELT